MNQYNAIYYLQRKKKWKKEDFAWTFVKRESLREFSQ